MKASTVGAILTVAAVLVLLGSLVAGIDPSGRIQEPPVLTAAGPPFPGQRIRVEVLNGTGVAGLAREVTTLLRDRGFDVVYYGNASRRDSTVVLDRAGDLTAVQAIARILEIDQVQTAIDTTLYLEATVLLGLDWTERGVEQESTPAPD